MLRLTEQQTYKLTKHVLHRSERLLEILIYTELVGILYLQTTLL